jgi:hypothetical protein
MKNANIIPFRSEYGFSSPSFTVDADGNIVATSIILSEPTDGGTSVVDFEVTWSGSGFLIDGYVGVNPSIELARNRTYRFSLDTNSIGFYIENIDGDEFNTGLIHSDGDRGEDAQGKVTGILQFTVPTNAPNVLKYSDGSSVFGLIDIIDPIGTFSSVSVNSLTNSTNSITGALKVAGGVGIEKSLYVGELINTHDIESDSSLNIVAANEIKLIISDSSVIGTVDTSGLSIPITNSTINNTVIGNVTPTTGVFTTAQVNTTPTNSTDVTNKNYVDTQVTALAIAFGL